MNRIGAKAGEPFRICIRARRVSGENAAGRIPFPHQRRDRHVAATFPFPRRIAEHAEREALEGLGLPLAATPGTPGAGEEADKARSSRPRPMSPASARGHGPRRPGACTVTSRFAAIILTEADRGGSRRRRTFRGETLSIGVEVLDPDPSDRTLDA